MGRKLRSHLDLVQPDLSSKLMEKQAAQKKGHDLHTKEWSRKIIQYFNFGNGPRWIPGVIAAVNGTRTFELKLNNGCTVNSRTFGSNSTLNRYE